MPVEVKVTITPESVAYLKKLYDAPRGMSSAIRLGLDNAMDTIKTRLIANRLSGSGPFDPSEHKLGEVSGVLQGSVYTRTAIGGGYVVGYIGAEAFSERGGDYAPVHEYGAVISAKNAPFLVFQILGRTIKTKTVTIPERAPFRTELESPETAETISEEVVAKVTELLSE